VAAVRINPASDFLRHARASSASELVRRYADDLLTSAHAYELPVPIHKIRRHLQVPVDDTLPLPGQRGLTLPELRILLNSDDLPTVRKFTEAHEYMEILCQAVRQGAADDWMPDELFEDLMDNKERFCDMGAAELVMPEMLYREHVPKPLTLAWARYFANFLGLSVTATVWRALETRELNAVLVIWRYAHKPSQKVSSSQGQLCLFGEPTEFEPPRMMRVAYRLVPESLKEFIPLNKSVPCQSTVFQAYEEDHGTEGYDELDLVGLRGRYYVESFPFRSSGERHVMSLIHLDDINER